MGTAPKKSKGTQGSRGTRDSDHLTSKRSEPLSFLLPLSYRSWLSLCIHDCADDFAARPIHTELQLSACRAFYHLPADAPSDGQLLDTDDRREPSNWLVGLTVV